MLRAGRLRGQWPQHRRASTPTHLSRRRWSPLLPPQLPCPPLRPPLPLSAADTSNPFPRPLLTPPRPGHSLASPWRRDRVVHFLRRQNQGMILTDSDDTEFANIPSPLRTVCVPGKTPRQEQIKLKYPSVWLSSLFKCCHFNWYRLLKAKPMAFCHVHYNFAIITCCKVISLRKTLLCHQH